MADFSEAMAKIHAFRTRFENLLQFARQRMPRAFESSEHGHSRLKLYSDFGSNPGNLRMLAHIPEGLPSGAPLVVALHGCGQDANVYHQGTGWSLLPIDGAFWSSIRNNNLSTIRKIASPGSCPVTRHAIPAKRFPFIKWSSTQSRSSARTEKWCS